MPRVLLMIGTLALLVLPAGCLKHTEPRCGDGYQDPGEECDCVTAATGYPAGCPGPNGNYTGATCRTTCERPRCGDGVRDAEEGCDGEALGGETCTTLGFVGGDLVCDSACLHDTTACWN